MKNNKFNNILKLQALTACGIFLNIFLVKEGFSEQWCSLLWSIPCFFWLINFFSLANEESVK